MEISLAGHAAIVTGGSKGIGLGVATRFASSGADVAIVARGREALDAARNSIAAQARGRVVALQGDVALAADVQRLYREAMAALGKIDIIVNNAGTSRAGPFENLTDEVMQQDLDQKFFAALRLTRLVWPQMKERRWGRVVNVLNIGAKSPRGGSAPTTVSRAAGMALTKVLAGEGAPFNILVNALLVGFIEADQHVQAAKRAGIPLADYMDHFAKEIPLGRAGGPRSSPTSRASSLPTQAPTSPAPPSMWTAAARRSSKRLSPRPDACHNLSGFKNATEEVMANAALAPGAAEASRHKPWYTILYVQVLIAIAVGILVGHFYPSLGVALKPLGDGFIALIKMMIAPVIFCTVVHGISSMSDLKKIGRVGVKTLLYFEVVSSIALIIGLIVGHVLQPGAGFNIDPASLDTKAVATYVTRAKEEGIVAHLIAIIPDTFVGAFARGDLLQILLVSILTGFAISRMGKLGEQAANAIDVMAKIFFGIIRIIVRAAPIGAFGAMAFTVGAFGVASLWNLIELILVFYFTSILFVLVVLGGIARFAGFSILRFIAYIKDELLIVVGTSSSETVLPQMIQKMQRLGASKSVVGLVIPTGYSFNLDGTNIYMTLAILFLAQATNTPLTLSQVLGILVIAMITSKGASGVTGAGFVTLAATLAIVPDIPIQSLAILVGIDKFMSECRALTNLIGNGVATVVISRWEGELDADKLHETMAHPVLVGEEMEHQPA